MSGVIDDISSECEYNVYEDMDIQNTEEEEDQVKTVDMCVSCEQSDITNLKIIGCEHKICHHCIRILIENHCLKRVSTILTPDLEALDTFDLIAKLKCPGCKEVFGFQQEVVDYVRIWVYDYIRLRLGFMNWSDQDEEDEEEEE